MSTEYLDVVSTEYLDGAEQGVLGRELHEVKTNARAGADGLVRL